MTRGNMSSKDGEIRTRGVKSSEKDEARTRGVGAVRMGRSGSGGS
jgi:hypothetical protein